MVSLFSYFSLTSRILTSHTAAQYQCIIYCCCFNIITNETPPAGVCRPLQWLSILCATSGAFCSDSASVVCSHPPRLSVRPPAGQGARGGAQERMGPKPSHQERLPDKVRLLATGRRGHRCSPLRNMYNYCTVYNVYMPSQSSRWRHHAPAINKTLSLFATFWRGESGHP